LGLFQAKIEEVAERAGVSAYDRLSLETMLAALPWPERRRIGLFLKGAKAQSDSSAVHRAVEMLLVLASQVWGEADSRAPHKQAGEPGSAQVTRHL
jgi:hypothetical protein